MGELFDNLIGLLPAVLFFLFLMRRLFGRRGGGRQTEGSSGSRDTAGEAAKRDRKSEPSSAPMGAAARIRKALGTAGEALGVSAYSPGTSQPVGSPEDKSRLEARTQTIPPTVPAAVSPAAAAPRASELSRRTAERAADTDSNSYARKGSSRQSSSLTRIEKLPPPARGVVWGVILGEPPGIKDL